MKRLISLMIIAAAFFTAAQDYSHISEKVKEYQNGDQLYSGQWGVMAKYADNGEVIVQNTSHFALAPASNMKLITTAAAFYYLGADFTFSTELFYDGEINEDGVLEGNIYIVGGGDPTLGSNKVESSYTLSQLMNKWADILEQNGITKVSGTVYADDNLYDRVPIPGNWSYTDMGNYYGAGTSALTIHDNLYYLYFEPSETPGEPAEVLRTEPEIYGLEFNNYMKTGKKGSGDNGYIYAAPWQFNATLRGTVPAGYDEFDIKGSIPDPPLFAAQYFARFMEDSADINIVGEPDKIDYKPDYSNMNLLDMHHSPTVKEIAEIINGRSFNLYAEMLLKAIGYFEGGEGSYDKGTELVEKFLKDIEVNTDALVLDDGSGLSRSNTITAEIMTGMLGAVTEEGWFDDYYSTISLAGDPDDIGFFSSFGDGTAIDMNARIKSGTINNVKCHSGYVTDKSGRLIVFSFLANNFPGRYSKVTDFHKELMIILAELQ